MHVCIRVRCRWTGSVRCMLKWVRYARLPAYAGARVCVCAHVNMYVCVCLSVHVYVCVRVYAYERASMCACVQRENVIVYVDP